MSAFYLSAGAFLLLNIALGLHRVVGGRQAAMRMIAAQLLGTTGLAIVLLLGAAIEEPAALDVAIVFALLAALATATFVRSAARPDGPRSDPGREMDEVDR